jgi:hypothetical protein
MDTAEAASVTKHFISHRFFTRGGANVSARYLASCGKRAYRFGRHPFRAVLESLGWPQRSTDLTSHLRERVRWI